MQQYGVEKQKSFAYVCIFGDDFRLFWETLDRADDHPPTEKPVESNDTYLNPGRKVRTVAPANQQLGRYAFRGYERIKNLWAWLWVGQWAWPGEM